VLVGSLWQWLFYLIKHQINNFTVKENMLVINNVLTCTCALKHIATPTLLHCHHVSGSNEKPFYPYDMKCNCYNVFHLTWLVLSYQIPWHPDVSLILHKKTQNKIKND
jgi:hypothetical protein